ncbi:MULTISPECIES: 2-oxoacid:acceptor oxidoreductase subunit alpha [Dethiosulfovibrio]|uniref:2-oxoacid:acceptor oxidoreductase subunit alpha n=2 Tax=Dethiosulfovibrio TaxID=47054 RepID=A0ABS9ESX5_9BACT|nr:MULTISPECIES: 2-oxoacid:acceptor oxidoreductase subunit alpha [Dethiosulfovibrio]MCF4113702.1 2-oxoacid:acceptor oxidoreductase subunit alpha [Dethiosulfovibrio russensis]MCF4143561.1 2-oxoacid:acceptor oxidoreductase subunit alpha [Dethiosulfovibrio marinus]MCF4145968.1 2-oxoacid:acceptor oxidoreductase subunit alpha [Dethiosulfovibrio acidaminovorans]
MGKVAFWQGNEALAMGALAAGCRFFGGYPITPSTEIAEKMAEELPKLDGRFIQMEDEISAIAATIGASIAGSKALTATSGPGFSLKQENLGLAYEAEIPIVVVDVMRGGPSTGLPTKAGQQDVMQARWGTHGDHGTIAYAPSSVEECYTMAIDAFNAAEKYRQPVLIMSDAEIGHMREKIEIPDPEDVRISSRKKPTVEMDKFVPYKADPEDDIPPMASFGDGYRWHVTGLTHNDWGFPTNNADEIEKKMTRLMRKIDRFRDDIVRYDTESVEDADILVVSYGSVARSSSRAVKDARARGMKVGHFRPVTLWPFPDKELEKLARKVKTIIVPELNCGQMVLEVERAVHGKSRVVPMELVNGDLFHPKDILEKISQEVR